MKRILYTGIIIVLLSGMVVGTASALSTDDLLARIGALTAQIDGLMKQISAPKGIASIDAFFFNLRAGVKNSRDVKKLQQFLIDNGYLSRGNATGNFLTLTKGALKRFQTAIGLPVTGVFDGQTRMAVNGLLKNVESAITAATSTQSDRKTILIKMATSTALVEEPSVTAQMPVSPIAVVEVYHIDPRPVYDVAALERATFDAVNLERQKNGLSVLQWNDQLADVARAHSSDQAGDNVKITDPDVPCLYPYIRHEGFVTGFKVGERLDNKNIPYSIAGENIIILPLTKDLIYRGTDNIPVCTQFSDLEGPVGETPDVARTRIQKSLLDRLALMIGQPKLNWVNKKWKSISDIASESTTDWMNSPGHRHNILTPEFEDGAIGAAVVNDYMIMTEVFLKKP